MKLTQPSRRAFLSTFAILSAGAAFGSVSAFLDPAGKTKDLQKEWTEFYKLSGGGQSVTFDQPEDEVPICAGHEYKKGDAVYFPKEGLIAVPTWIYWSNNPRKPSDVFITFFEKKNGAVAKSNTFNRFEMEAIYANLEKLNGLAFIKKSSPQVFKVKTHIRRRAQKQHFTFFNGKELIFENKFTNHL